ncbi:DUF732 domain-containing protein [Streptosporangium sp. NBC_01756]|uniref:DUF732 domain-containing protein n=1 Tax=Streptosporangium sp. NBC_01756 TaxID=2975950 RepID=UPI002DDC47EF|nr:DUF732 domain-containing protein [Streptosporangium sp. NBC_01756]WSC86995.1 hypothetical protein OIE48_01865 [Streptosporangium sp. NBC_01756]
MAVIAVVAVVGVLGLLAGLAALPGDGAERSVAKPAASASTPVPAKALPMVDDAEPSMVPTPTPDPSASAREAVFTASVKQRKALKDADSYKLGRLGWDMCKALEEGKGFAAAAALGTSGFDLDTSEYIARVAIVNLCPHQRDKIPV